MRSFRALLPLLWFGALSAQESKPLLLPHFNYEVAAAHEIKPHRTNVPVDGVEGGFHQLSLTLTVSAVGDVTRAEASGDDATMKFWPKLQGEVEQWRFVPFEESGKPVTAQVEEYLNLVPGERLPKVHAKAPEVRPNSKVTITLDRGGCLGSCPVYAVTLSTDGIVFEGSLNVVAAGRHVAAIDADAVRKLAKEFTAADFYSFDPMYLASVTDCPTHQLSISIDGRRKAVEDYVGTWVGMPAVVQELEDAVDAVAETKRWVSGVDGLVAALRAENFDFGTFDAQVIVKEASTRGETRTVAELLDSGVSVKPMPAPKPKEAWMPVRFEGVRWLTAAAGNPETLALLIQREVSKNDQADKKLALAKAAESGRLTAVRALIGYGANPNAELKHRAGTGSSEAAESVLIDAAKSGNPEVVREILSYHPQLEARDGEGKTALFAAGEYESSDVDGARAECVRLLVRAGANVNARDKDGNTPLHETYLTEVEEELLKLGADVNARNKDGETPIFTTVDIEAIALFAAHGADFSIRNKKGQTAYEAAAQYRGAAMQEALLAAMQKR